MTIDTVEFKSDGKKSHHFLKFGWCVSVLFSLFSSFLVTSILVTGDLILHVELLPLLADVKHNLNTVWPFQLCLLTLSLPDDVYIVSQVSGDLGTQSRWGSTSRWIRWPVPTGRRAWGIRSPWWSRNSSILRNNRNMVRSCWEVVRHEDRFWYLLWL